MPDASSSPIPGDRCNPVTAQPGQAAPLNEGRSVGGLPAEGAGAQSQMARLVLELPGVRVVELAADPRQADDLEVQELTAGSEWQRVVGFNTLSNDYAFTSARQCAEDLARRKAAAGEAEFEFWLQELRSAELPDAATAGHVASRAPTTGDMLNALGRAIERLQAEADALCDAHDYSAEFPAADAESLRHVVTLLGGDRASRVQFQHTPDPMEAPLPCKVQVGHMAFGKGVPLRSLVDHLKRMYTLVHGRGADEVANEPLEVRKARGDAFLERMQLRPLIETADSFGSGGEQGAHPARLRASFDVWHERRMHDEDYRHATDKGRAWLAVLELSSGASLARPAAEQGASSR